MKLKELSQKNQSTNREDSYYWRHREERLKKYKAMALISHERSEYLRSISPEELLKEVGFYDESFPEKEPKKILFEEQSNATRKVQAI